MYADLIEQARQRQQAETEQQFHRTAAGGAPTGPGRPATTGEDSRKLGGMSMLHGVPVPTAEEAFTFMRELPVKSIIGGIRDATQEQLNSLASYYEWVTDAAADGEVTGMLAAAVLPGGARMTEAKTSGKVDSGDVKEAASDALPEVEDPTTTLGMMGRKITQFTTGMAGPAKAMKAVGVGTWTASMISGAISDGTAFAPSEENIAELVQSFPVLRNDITEFLAHKKEDPEVVGRIKNVVQGAVPGMMVEGFMRGLRVLRASRAARGVTAAIDDIHGTAPLKAEAFDDLGARGKPLMEAVEVTDEMRALSTGGAKGRRVATVARKLKKAEQEAGGVPLTDAEKARLISEEADLAEALPAGSLIEADGGRGVFINWARIDTDEDIKAVLQTTADLHKSGIDEARRGVQTNAATKELADAMGMDVGDLLQRNAGEPKSAEWAVAARKLWVSSGAKVRELAAKAADPNAGMVDQFNFRKMMATHHAIQKEVIAARTETARALQSWKIPVGAGEEQARALSAIMDAHGGDVLSRKFAQRIAAADAAGLLDDAALGKLAERGAGAKVYDAFLEAWINGLLSNPLTHAVNMGSNSIVIANSIAERAAAGRVARALGETDGVMVGEAMHQMIGVMEGLKDNWRMLAKDLRMKARKVRGLPVLDDGVSLRPPGMDMTKLDTPVQKAITGENFGLRTGTMRDPKNWLGNAADATGTAARTPGLALNVEDQFFKTMGYRMELHAQAFRSAAGQGLEGAALKRRVAELVANPPKEIRMAAVDNALYQTFTRPLGEAGQAFTRWANLVTGGRIVFPFIRTPTNILKYSFGERTPLGLLSKNIRADLAAEGARGQLARTKMALGTAAMLTAMDMVYSGHLTGGGAPDARSRDGMRRQGIQPWSIKVGDRYYQYSRVGGVGEILALGANIGEFAMWSLRETEDPTEIDEVMSAAALSFGEIFINKTYMQGLANVVEAVQDPERYGTNYVEKLAGSLVPSGVAQVARASDPYLKEVNGMLEAVQSKTPGWGKGLPNVRDFWGREIEYRSGIGWMYDVMSPIYSTRENPNSIDKEMQRLEYYPGKPNRKVSFNGAVINLENHPWVYDRYVELSGNSTKDLVTGLGAFDELNALVEGAHPLSGVYASATDGPEGGKVDMIQGIIAKHRVLARNQLLEDFPELKALVDQHQREVLEKHQQAAQR